MVQAVLVANALLVLVPMLVMALSAFKSTREIFQKPFGLPAIWRIETPSMPYSANKRAATVISWSRVSSPAAFTRAADALARLAAPERELTAVEPPVLRQALFLRRLS